MPPEIEKSESEKRFSITEIKQGQRATMEDTLAVEEPMEIRVVFGPTEKRTGRSLAITMRTPDHDFELAAGFLFCENIISSPTDIKKMELVGPIAEGREKPNIVRVELDEKIDLRMQDLQRHFYTTSSCGICGKGSLDALDAMSLRPVESNVKISADIIHTLPGLLRTGQEVFQNTGGIHAAGLFDTDGQMLCLREDVGRHNAFDKLIGHQLLASKMPDSELPSTDLVAVLSGRASFELLQKTLSASFPILVAVGAPSSLAVELALRFGVTLIGFTSKDRFNIYSHPECVT